MLNTETTPTEFQPLRYATAVSRPMVLSNISAETWSIPSASKPTEPYCFSGFNRTSPNTPTFFPIKADAEFYPRPKCRTLARPSGGASHQLELREFSNNNTSSVIECSSVAWQSLGFGLGSTSGAVSFPSNAKQTPSGPDLNGASRQSLIQSLGHVGGAQCRCHRSGPRTRTGELTSGGRNVRSATS